MVERSSRTFTLIELMLVIAIIAIIAAIAVPNLIQARKYSQESTAIGALKTITTAESMFHEGDKDKNGTLDYGTLAQLSAAQLIDAVLGSGTKHGYVYQVGPSGSTPEFLWFSSANPVLPLITGDRYYQSNHSGAIFYTVTGSLAFNSTDCLPSPTAIPLGK